MGFVGPKLIWAVGNPLTLLAALMALALVLQLTPWRRLGGRLALVACAAALLIGAAPLTAWLVAPLENRFPPPPAYPAQVDGIILLGGATQPTISDGRGQPGVNHNGERILAFAELVRRYPAARAVVSGGSGSLRPGRLAEADIVRDILQRLGFETGAILFESESRTTYESARNLRRTLQIGDDETWLLVTSAWHMPRAIGSFRRQGLSPVAWPVDYRTSGPSPGLLAGWRWPSLMNGFNALFFGLREWTGLTAYYLMDRTDDWFPAARPRSPRN